MKNLATSRFSGKMLPLLASTEAPRNWRDWIHENIEKGRSQDFQCRIDIDAELASLLLAEFNGRNRPLRVNGAEEWAARIKRDEWMVTSQGISLGADGHLNNGQHRLAGIAASGRTVPCWVMFGEPVEAFYVLDTQRTRSAADALHILQEKHPVLLAASARLLVIVQSSTPRTMSSATTRLIGHAVIAETVLGNPSLRQAMAPAHRFNAAIPKTSSAGAAVAWHLINTRSSVAGRLPEFWEVLCTGLGITKERDACNVLRRAAQTGRISPTKGSPGPYVAASILIAWNLWSAGKQANGVSWPDKAPFPAPR